jgi:hypothetical protein
MNITNNETTETTEKKINNILRVLCGLKQYPF